MPTIPCAKALARDFDGAMSLSVKTLRFLLTSFCFLAVAHGVAAEQQTQIGPVSRLPIPRFVSLKSDRVNLREGPSKGHRTLWVYERAGLPMEVTAEFEIWRKVRDSEGVEGWVLHSLLSGRRTALVAPWKKEPLPLFDKDHATALAKLEPNVIANLRGCDGTWCRVSGRGFDGYMKQENLWGVYPGEKVN
jgi:SH3-like domain-containing protein